MSPTLLDLPQELIFCIADLLLQDEVDDYSLDQEESESDRFEDQGQEQSSVEGSEDHKNHDETGDVDDASRNQTVDDQESQKKVEEPKSDQASSGVRQIYHLSRTCSSLYKPLSSYIFRTVRLSNTKKSGKAIQYLFQTDQIANVKCLQFQAEASGGGEENFHDVDGVFPDQANDILSNLSRFTHLETLVIDLNFHLNESEKFQHLEDDVLTNSPDQTIGGIEGLENAVEEESWRASTKTTLMNRTLEAILRNKTTSVRRLVYKDYPIRVNSTFGSEHSNQWLENLESFRCEICGADTGAEGMVNTAPHFQMYINNLDNRFFNTLQNVTRLAIIGHKEGAIGQQFHHEARLPLKTESVPKLKELEFGYYFIQDDLLDFLIAHSSTLERLVFNNCFMHFTGIYYYYIDEDQNPEDIHEDDNEFPLDTWDIWFHRYASAAPQKLRHLSFSPSNAPIFNELAQPGYNETNQRALAKQKARGFEIRIFPYASIYDGKIIEQVGRNLRRAWRRLDMDGWDKLRDVMRTNCEKNVQDEMSDDTER